jgi:hypothetical protein
MMSGSNAERWFISLQYEGLTYGNLVKYARFETEMGIDDWTDNRIV